MGLFLISEGNTPKDYVWKNRILIIQHYEALPQIEPTLEKSLKANQKLLIYSFENEKLSWTTDQSKVNEASFRAKLSPSDSSKSRWVLIGLDGGVKASGSKPPEIQEIVKLIDAMPMRQSEIRRKGDGNR